MLGRKWPLLSSTATSNSTVLTSLLKVGVSAGSSLSFLLNFEGIFGSSTAGSSLAGADGAGADVAGLDVVGLGSVAVSAGGFFLRGLATVSDESDPGPLLRLGRRGMKLRRVR